MDNAISNFPAKDSVDSTNLVHASLISRTALAAVSSSFLDGLNTNRRERPSAH